ncbi:MAG: vWA domain-containing protein [Myxococcota bacterium]
MHRLALIATVFGVLAACQEYELKQDPDDPQIVDTDLPPVDTDEPPVPTPPPEAPDIEVEPMLLPFGFLPAQCLSEPELVTVRNVGGGDLVINDIFFVDSVGAFNETGTSTVVAPGGIYQFYVEFIPLYDGQWLDYVRIASNDPDESVVDVVADGTGANGGIITDGFVQNAASAIDVLFVLDNSGSMSDNLDALANEFPQFIQNFVALGLDYQIAVVTTDMDDPTQSGRIQGPIISNASADPVGDFVAITSLGATGSGDERGLDAAFAALDPSVGLINTTNAGFARPGSNLSIIVVSDENDGSNMNPAPFTTWLDNYQGDPDLSNLSIVGGPRQGLFPCISIIGGVSASPVPRYWSVARDTGGIHANLCNVNFDVIVQQLATVAAGLRVNYDLAAIPGDPNTVGVTVNGVPLPQNATNGWTYDPATNLVEFHGTGVPDEGANVEITYEGETVCPN